MHNTRLAILVIIGGCGLLAVLGVLAMKSWEWWRYLLTVLGLAFLIPIGGGLLGRKIVLTIRKKYGHSASLAARIVFVVLFICMYVVTLTFVFMPTLEDALKRLAGFLRVETLGALILISIIAAFFPAQQLRDMLKK